MSDRVHITKRDRHGNKVWLTWDETWSWDYGQRAIFTERMTALLIAKDLGGEVER